MAKRKPKKARHPAKLDAMLDDLIPPELLDEFDQALLAGELAERAELRTVFLAEADVYRVPGAAPQAADSIIDMIEPAPIVQRSPGVEGFAVIVPFSLEIRPNEPESEPAVGIDCTFVAVFHLDSHAGLNDENYGAFAVTTALMAVYPYWREFVQGTMAKMMIPPIVLPLLRI